jgi:hypothetical protein
MLLRHQRSYSTEHIFLCKPSQLQSAFVSNLFDDKVCLQVQELQKRIQELEDRILDQRLFESSASLGVGALVSDPSMQPECMSSIAFRPDSTPQLNTLKNLELVTPNDGLGGAWIIGNQRYPELKGRAMRDAGVQVQFSPPPVAAMSHLQEHAQVQTDNRETIDRASSPLPAPPPAHNADDGKRTCALHFHASSA